MSFEEFVQSVDKEELEKQIMSSPKYVNLCRNAVHAVKVYYEGRAETVTSLVKSGLLKLEEAAAFLNLSIEDMQQNISQEQS